MPKTKISEFSATPGNNTDIDGINIAEGCAPSGINDAIRELMAQLKDFQAGTAGDSFNGPVGTTTAAAGAFTTLSASGNITVSGGTANGVAYLNGSKVLTTGSALTFDGTILTTSRINITNTGTGATFSSSGGSGMRIYGSSGTNQWDLYLNGANVRFSDNTGGGKFVVDTDATIYGVTVGRGAGAVSTNTAVGASALAANTTGSSITGVGYQALTANTTGNNSVAFGVQALRVNTTGNDNSAFGTGALYSSTTGSANTAIGKDALVSNTTASNNTAVGYQAGYSNTTASNCVFVGHQAGYSSTTAIYNTFFGQAAGYNATGNLNTFIGPNAGYYVTTGSKNTILGTYSGNQGGLDIRTASNYIVLSDGDGNPRASCTTAGAWYFYNTGGAGSDVVNAYSGAAAGTGRSLYTGWYGATSPTVGTLSFNVTTNGDVTNTNNSYGAISDIKLKENIVDASPKLDDMMRVRIVNFNFKSGQTHKQIGVIAQELEQVFPSMVEEAPDTDIDGNDLGTTTKQVKYSVFVPMLIKAIQELKTELDTVKAELATLKGA